MRGNIRVVRYIYILTTRFGQNIYIYTVIESVHIQFWPTLLITFAEPPMQQSLGGNAKTLLIATVSPSAACSGETLSTLQFAERTSCLRNNARVNHVAR
jgi:hypothetical protein